jgi:16S rRNA (guanine527-N7)-methyltransferase
MCGLPSTWESEHVTGVDPVGTEIEVVRARVDPMIRNALARSFELGFLGTMPIEDQIDHALGFVVIVESLVAGSPESVVDLGTGGGVPGLVLASCWPAAQVVLLDASERRTVFLRETVESWPAAAGVEVVRGRAEDFGRSAERRQRFQVVTSRSFGTTALTAECGAALLRTGGWMVVSEPPQVRSEDRWPTDGLSLVGMESIESRRVCDRFGYRVLSKVTGIADRFPRRVGIPAKRPLF